MTPIVYLPGVSRPIGQDSPASLHPLIELQYRGATWHQKNGRPWSVDAFLGAVLELDVAADARTREAMLRALPFLADAQVGSLRGHRLDADDFDGLAVGDPVRDLLRWMANPKPFRAGRNDAEWESFRSLTKSSFGIDPEDAEPTEAATLLAEGGGKWEPKMVNGGGRFLHTVGWCCEHVESGRHEIATNVVRSCDRCTPPAHAAGVGQQGAAGRAG